MGMLSRQTICHSVNDTEIIDWIRRKVTRYLRGKYRAEHKGSYVSKWCKVWSQFLVSHHGLFIICSFRLLTAVVFDGVRVGNILL